MYKMDQEHLNFLSELLVDLDEDTAHRVVTAEKKTAAFPMGTSVCDRKNSSKTGVIQGMVYDSEAGTVKYSVKADGGYDDWLVEEEHLRRVDPRSLRVTSHWVGSNPIFAKFSRGQSIEDLTGDRGTILGVAAPQRGQVMYQVQFAHLKAPIVLPETALKTTESSKSKQAQGQLSEGDTVEAIVAECGVPFAIPEGKRVEVTNVLSEEERQLSGGYDYEVRVKPGYLSLVKKDEVRKVGAKLAKKAQKVDQARLDAIANDIREAAKQMKVEVLDVRSNIEEEEGPVVTAIFDDETGMDAISHILERQKDYRFDDGQDGVYYSFYVDDDTINVVLTIKGGFFDTASVKKAQDTVPVVQPELPETAGDLADVIELVKGRYGVELAPEQASDLWGVLTGEEGKMDAEVRQWLEGNGLVVVDATAPIEAETLPAPEEEAVVEGIPTGASLRRKKSSLEKPTEQEILSVLKEHKEWVDDVLVSEMSEDELEEDGLLDKDGQVKLSAFMRQQAKFWAEEVQEGAMTLSEFPTQFSTWLQEKLSKKISELRQRDVRSFGDEEEDPEKHRRSEPRVETVIVPKGKGKPVTEGKKAQDAEEEEPSPMDIELMVMYRTKKGLDSTAGDKLIEAIVGQGKDASGTDMSTGDRDLEWYFGLSSAPEVLKIEKKLQSAKPSLRAQGVQLLEAYASVRFEDDDPMTIEEYLESVHGGKHAKKKAQDEEGNEKKKVVCPVCGAPLRIVEQTVRAGDIDPETGKVQWQEENIPGEGLATELECSKDPGHDVSQWEVSGEEDVLRKNKQ